MSDRFDWAGDTVVLPEQPATAVYTNPHGAVVVRQEGGPYDEDCWIIIRPENALRLCRAILAGSWRRCRAGTAATASCAS